MSDRGRTSNSETDFQQLSSKLIDTGALALTVDAEVFVGDEELFLSIYEPTNDSQKKEQLSSLCRRIESVQIHGTEVAFNFKIDRIPPCPISSIGVYIPEQVAGLDAMSFNEISLKKGLNNLTSLNSS